MLSRKALALLFTETRRLDAEFFPWATSYRRPLVCGDGVLIISFAVHGRPVSHLRIGPKHWAWRI